MSIKFVTGKPGGGKSLRSMKIVAETLLESDKLLVTNLPLNLDSLLQYCLNHGKPINVFERVLILNRDLFGNERDYKSALKEFFLYRSITGQPCSKPAIDDRGNYLEELNFPSETFGRVYIIDEIHKLWPARDFQKVDKLIFEYLAEHRHFSDEVVFITQALAQVDKQIRLLGQDFEVIRNRKKERYSIFAGPPTFTRYVFLSAPNGSGNQVPAEKHNFSLDLSLASCYSTSAKGGEADTKQTVKGVPFRLIYPVAALMVFALWAIATQGPKWIFSETSDQNPDASQQVVNDYREPAKSIFSDLPKTSSRRITGYYVINDRAGRVWFDDGTSLSLYTTTLEQVHSDGLTLAGTFYPFVLPSPNSSNVANAPQNLLGGTL